MTRQVDSVFFFFFGQYVLAHCLTHNPGSSVSLLKRGPCAKVDSLFFITRPICELLLYCRSV